MTPKSVPKMSKTDKGGTDHGSGPLARVRIVLAPRMYLGPGKADLLEAVARTGSISAAGRELGMSYRRAWLLIEAVNQLFARPLVLSSVGGAHGGGARLTDLGKAVIAAYRRIEDRARQAAGEEMAAFAAEFAPAVTGKAAASEAAETPPVTSPARHLRREARSAAAD
jgi:molybdate transport system regulatory protein